MNRKILGFSSFVRLSVLLKILNVLLIIGVLLTAIVFNIEQKSYIDNSSLRFEGMSKGGGNSNLFTFTTRIKLENEIYKIVDYNKTLSFYRLFNMQISKNSIPSYIKDIELIQTNLFTIKSSVNLLEEKYKIIILDSKLKYKNKVYLLFIAFILMSLIYLFLSKILRKYFDFDEITTMLFWFYVVFLLSNIFLKLHIVYFSIIDFLSVFVIFFIVYFITNYNKKISYLASSLLVLYYFTQNIVLTFQNKMLSYSNIEILYTTTLAILNKTEQILMILVTFLYVSLIIYVFTIVVFNIYKNFKRNLFVIFVLTFFIILFNNIVIFKQYIWEVDFQGYSKKYGILLAKNFDIYFNNLYNQEITKEDVKNALSILIPYENERDINPLLLESTKVALKKGTNLPKRDIYLIFLESFYDYSHFIPAFEKDPFSSSYRKWANHSRKIGHNGGGGSFYARLSGLTASNPLYPSNKIVYYEDLLPSLFIKKGYETFAIEEAISTYNLGTLLPSFGFNNVIFDIGTGEIRDYIKSSILPNKKAKFVYGFTLLGHTSSLKSSTKQIVPNESTLKFLSLFEDEKYISETLLMSIILSEEIIKTKDLIIKENPNAVIMFKHDHLYPMLIGDINNSSIDDNLKEDFLKEEFINPMLIWDGQYGAFKAPIGFVPENIPLFIAVNFGLDYKNSPISLLYKDVIDDQVSTYNKFYNINQKKFNNIKSKNDISNEIIRVEKAKDIISRDIFQGKQYTYELLKEK